MNPTDDDLLARRIVAHLGKQPTVSDEVSARLANARHLALSHARAARQPVRMGTVLAARSGSQSPQYRVLFWAGLVAAALYCATIASHSFSDSGSGWDADDDNGSYVELLRD